MILPTSVLFSSRWKIISKPLAQFLHRISSTLIIHFPFTTLILSREILKYSFFRNSILVSNSFVKEYCILLVKHGF
ncbi:hypothetical protein TREPR_3528 [Treponema primitia ZAS-2]|uniref:Uncharacterized protein n=1 Tax=Treponema primitia (strain ATCC BAA-887 / DSM 12427 / ZAS-2) TaxID=545694 RepID=F5YIU7_TREPZ|nr:hypothetical protein TREPR_3528 [Treponema primitia ZAS-2]